MKARDLVSIQSERHQTDFAQVARVWLASYPRSGNTLLRTILYQCLGLPSASVYPNDLGGNAELAKFVGHLERNSDGRVDWPADVPKLIKLHEIGAYYGPAIYVVRNGRDAVLSLHRFYRGKVSMEDVIAGHTKFGTWADHVAFWHPEKRGNTLLLRYEDLLSNLDESVKVIADMFKRPVVRRTLPSREVIADAHWVRSREDRPTPMTEAQLQLFDRVNGDMMREFGYALE